MFILHPVDSMTLLLLELRMTFESWLQCPFLVRDYVQQLVGSRGLLHLVEARLRENAQLVVNC